MFKLSRRFKRLLWALLVAAVAAILTATGIFSGGFQFDNHFIENTKSKMAEFKSAYEIILPKVAEESSSSAEGSESSDMKDLPKAKAGELRVHFIDVGNADAILIACDGEYALVDAGENDCGEQIVDYLKKQDVDSLKYVVGTHAHSDHIGGLDTVLNQIPTDTVMLPLQEGDTETYQDVKASIKENDLLLTTPKPGDIFMVGSAVLTILNPAHEWEDLNNSSIVIRVINGAHSFLLTGDIDREAENEIVESGMDVESTVLKAPHHGSNTSSGYVFLRAVNPQYIVIPCGKDNEYGHPHEEVLSRYADLGATVYRADENGTIIACSDGAELTFKTERG